MKVAFQGEAGAYSEQAVFNYFGADVKTLPCETFDLVFDSVTSGLSDFALIPIENSLAGSIHQNYDLLAKNNLYVVGETILRVQHCLIAMPDVKKEEIKKAISHPQALAQCASYLKKLNIKPETVYDTAGSVNMLKESGARDTAAIASKRAAEIYGMQILEEGIEDSEKNFTRFLCLGRESIVPEKEAKTSLVFASKANDFVKVLNVFASHQIEITKIESRPLQNKTWEYLFFVDVLGLVNETILNELGELTEMYRVLGSYPRKRPAG